MLLPPRRAKSRGDSIASISARCRSTAASSPAETAPACTRTSSTPACGARTANSTARVDWIGDFTTGTGDRPAVKDADDCDPPPSPGTTVAHGTHVASILAGRTFGVARAARVHALRILPCTGTTRTDFIAAVRAVELDHRAWLEARGRQHQPGALRDRRSRAGRGDRSLDPRWLRLRVVGRRHREPRRLLAAACRRDAITVGSTDAADAARQSGYGPHLTLFAPGIRIQGAGSASDTAEFIGRRRFVRRAVRRGCGGALSSTPSSGHSGGGEGRDRLGGHARRRHESRVTAPALLLHATAGS